LNQDGHAQVPYNKKEKSMKLNHFFSKIMIIAALMILDGALHAANIYLKNSTGYLLQFKFGTPEQNAKEYNLDKVFLFNSDNITDFIQDISIRRSGAGSGIYAPWTKLDTNGLKNKTKNIIEKFNKAKNTTLILRDINWIITATRLGWDVEPKGIMEVKK
jgi:hypothetical protein